LARALNSELTIFRVAGLPIVLAEDDFEISPEKLQDARKVDAAILEEAEAIAKNGNVAAKTILVSGKESVARTILEYAETNKIDLVVVGTRGLGGFKKLLLGNAASNLVNYSHCSVLNAK
jgi:nucleotide-binding universal stress UspA family protein